MAELGAYIDTKPDFVVWRQGRCLPYGDGITFWALGEIVKAHAGILESDTAEVAQAKLEAVLPEGVERPWFRQRLRPLLGIEADLDRRTGGAVHRLAAVPGVRRRAASDRARVRGPALGRRRDARVPRSISPTAPRRCRCWWSAPHDRSCSSATPATRAGLRNVNMINLAPLSEEETARLVSALLETTVIPVELQQPILERRAAIPLYAEEFVRLLKDKDLLRGRARAGSFEEGAEMPFPDSVQALIAARLDTLAADTKSLLADAAVVGKVFWAGAVASMGDRDLGAVADALARALAQGARAPRPSIVDRRGSRVRVLARARPRRRLRSAAEGIPEHRGMWRLRDGSNPMAQERVEDLAEVLAYHYATALELARAAGDGDRIPELEPPAMQIPVARRGARARPRRGRGGVEPGAGARARTAGTPGACGCARPLRRRGGAGRPLPGGPGGPRRGRRDPPGPRTHPRGRRRDGQAHLGVPEDRRSAGVGVSGGGGRALGAVRAGAGARRRAHRGGRERGDPGQGQRSDRRRGAGLGARRVARLGAAAARARVPGDGTTRRRGRGWTRGLPRSDRSLRPLPGWDARWLCSTTTSGWQSGLFEGPAAALGVLGDGIAFARARGLTEWTNMMMVGSLDELDRCRRTRPGTRDGRGTGRAARAISQRRSLHRPRCRGPRPRASWAGGRRN